MEKQSAGLGRANALLEAGALAEAEQAFAELLEQRPDDPDVLHGLGVIAWQAGRLEEARERLLRATDLAAHAAYWCTLGEIERLRGDYGAAELALAKALELEPSHPEALCNRGMLLLSQESFEQAVDSFRLALEGKPAMAIAHYNLGIALKELNRLDEAIAAYRQAIELRPDFAVAHVNLAIALLLDGQLEEGFEEYEWRLKPPFRQSPADDVPAWDGLVDPQANLLLSTEQGAGDAIQFARYIPFIAREGMRVIVRCPAGLEGLMQSVEGVSSTYRLDEKLPPHKAQLQLLSLPRLFATRLDKIPVNIPYLRPAFAEVRRWQERLDELGETIKVGLRWAGNPANSEDRRRSVPLTMFAQLADTNKMTLIGLNNEPLSGAEAEAAGKLKLVDFSAELKDFSDTAALLSNLDLVISVDTAVLHLAGALGRPTWALLRFSPHWPWLLDRDDSPWYPGLKLFRQPCPGDWQTVIDYVVSLLREVMNISRQEQSGEEGADV